MTDVEPQATSSRPRGVAERVASLLDGGHLDLPLPGSGGTLERLARLRDLGEADLVAARLAEAHTDAMAILTDLLERGPDAPPRGMHRQLWGVWAADPPHAPLRATRDGGSGTYPGCWSLNGDKPWCSGVGVCERALLTAHTDEGYRLFAVDPRHPGVTVRPSRWAGIGMSDSHTRDLELRDVPARAVGAPGAYLDRPGFWWGAAGVAAVWLGGALRASRALERSAARHGSELVLASLGRVDAAQHAAWCTLVDVAHLADTSGAAGPASARATGEPDDVSREDRVAGSRLAASRARAAVETAVEVTLHETGRATGPGPLAMDAEHARAVADLQVYVRQSHGDRDLAVLGGLALAARTSGLRRP